MTSAGRKVVMRGATRALTVLAVVAIGGCALPPWIGHPPVFPAGAATSWEIPLYEPLTGVGPNVVATICGAARAGKPRVCEEALLYVDSGSSHSALPAEAFARLGVETSRSWFATIEDAAGDKRAWSGGLVPEVRVGDLALSSVVAAVHERVTILGAAILTAHGWRIDLDRGVLMLGPPPAGTGAARLEPGDAVRVRVHVAASSARPWRYLFGCLDDAGRLRGFPVWLQIGVRRPAAGEERVVDVEMPGPLRQLFRQDCAGLALLDVNPVLPTVRPMTADVEARFVFGFSHYHLG